MKLEAEQTSTVASIDSEQQDAMTRDNFTTEHSTQATVEPKSETVFPEGGVRAWSVVFGGFLAFFCAWQLINSTGVYQTYIATHQLRDVSPSAVGWIFGLNSFMSTLGGVLIGPICDAKGPRIPLSVGSMLCVLFYATVGLCSEYWHFLVTIGLLSGTATSLIFIPTVITVGHYFSRKRGLATGIIYSGGSLGGIVVPLVLNAAIPKVGFAWATRIVGLVTLALIACANALVRPRLASSKDSLHLVGILPKWSLFRSIAFTSTSISVFLLNLALFIPLAYLPAYVLSVGLSQQTAFYTMTFLNVGSFVGRWVPAYLSDRVGRFNMLMSTVALCALSTLLIWQLAGSNVAVITLFAVVFGFASGSNLSLAPVCIGQLCAIQQYGQYYSTAIVLACIGSLVGNPIAGTILASSNGQYRNVMIFAGSLYLMGVISLFVAKGKAAGWHPKVKF